MLNVIRKFFKDIERYNHPPRSIDQLLQLVTKLDPGVFQGIQSSDKSILQVIVPYPTIQEYNEEVVRNYNCLKSGTIVRLDKLQETLKALSIASFFLSKSHCYIDEATMIVEFNKNVMDLAVLYKEKLDDENIATQDRHNLRHISLLINNLHELYQEFSNIVIS